MLQMMFYTFRADGGGGTGWCMPGFSLEAVVVQLHTIVLGEWGYKDARIRNGGKFWRQPDRKDGKLENTENMETRMRNGA